MVDPIPSSGILVLCRVDYRECRCDEDTRMDGRGLILATVAAAVCSGWNFQRKVQEDPERDEHCFPSAKHMPEMGLCQLE